MDGMSQQQITLETPVLAGTFKVAISLIPPTMLSFLKSLTIPNPAVAQLNRMGLYSHHLPKKFPVILMDDTHVWLPRKYVHEFTQATGIHVEDLRTKGRSLTNTTTPIPLRDYQVDPVNEVERDLRRSGVALLQAPTAFGKTVVAVELHRRLGVPAIVLVSQSTVVDQWARTYEKFWPEAVVGFARQKKFQTGADCDVVIGMTQSVMKGKYGPDFYCSFGLVMNDEIQDMGADQWRTCLTLFNAYYLFGFTATPTRKDQKHKFFFEYLCPPSTKVIKATMTPDIYPVNTDASIPLERYAYPWTRPDAHSPEEKVMKPDLHRLASFLYTHEERNRKIVRQVVRAAGTPRISLVLAKEIAHLKDLKSLFSALWSERNPEQPEPFTALFTGEQTKEEQDLARTANVIWATYAIFSKNVDVPRLDTLFLAAPVADSVQQVGRILRQQEGKKNPIVVDFVDQNIPILLGWWRARSRRYTQLHYHIYTTRTLPAVLSMAPEMELP